MPRGETFEVAFSGEHFDQLCSDACSIIDAGRKHAYQAVNTVMVYSYYELGRRVVEEEQGGEVRAEYGKQVIVRLSKALTRRYKRGFSVTNLKQMRSFFLLYSRDEIGQTVSDQFANLPKTREGRAFPLSWSHYLKIMRIEDGNERHFYGYHAPCVAFCQRQSLRREASEDARTACYLLRAVSQFDRHVSYGYGQASPCGIKEPMSPGYLCNTSLHYFAVLKKTPKEARVFAFALFCSWPTFPDWGILAGCRVRNVSAGEPGGAKRWRS